MTQLKTFLSPALTSAALTAMLGAAVPCAPVLAAPSGWVATWQASPQPVWGPGFLFPTHAPSELRDQTVRQIVRVSLGGQRLRIELSNAYGNQPVTLGKATVAVVTAGGETVPGSLRRVTFGGRDGASIPPGASSFSDPVALPLPALAHLAVSVYVPDATAVSTFHWDGRQTGWVVPGEQVSASVPVSVSVPAPAPVLVQAQAQANDGPQRTTARLLLTGVHIEAGPAARAVVVMGDSITDGATATLDQNRRWPDFLAVRLAPRGVAVVNAGISGARLLADGMGANALARLGRDVLAQPGVCSVIVMLGINDISWPGTAFARTARRPTLGDLTAGYQQVVTQAHSHGIRVIGATLTPFEGALPGTPLDDYYQPDKDALRQQVNDWIRHSGTFDAVIDFDAVLQDPAHPNRIAARYDSGDHLHPGDEGNRAMAEVVDIDALLPPGAPPEGNTPPGT